MVFRTKPEANEELTLQVSNKGCSRVAAPNKMQFRILLGTKIETQEKRKKILENRKR